MEASILLVFCLFFPSCFSQEKPCTELTSIDITNGTNSSGTFLWDKVEYKKGEYYEDKGKVWGCICMKKKCIRRCCDPKLECDYEMFMDIRNDTIISIFNGTKKTGIVNPEYYYFLFDYSCPDNLLFQDEKEREYFLVQEDGSVFDSVHKLFYTVEDYCLIDGTVAVVCEESGKTDEKVNIDCIGMMISMPFLLITFLVYLVLPESILHRKALMSYVLALLVAYISLVFIQKYEERIQDLPCNILAYLVIFFFLASFFWMNVMCVDMWLAFRGLTTVISKRSAEKRRYIFYCIYAWGIPMIHVGIVLLLDHFAPIDSSYSPQIGDKTCFLGTGMPTFYYYYLPIAILICINVVLFVMTTVRIQTIQKETSMLKQVDSKISYEENKQKFNLYLKLMIAMGVNWIMELVSWTVNQLVAETPHNVWYLTDFINAMYGVFIFFIFVFKKNIWQSLKKRYYIFIGKPHLAHTLTTSSARGTRTSNYSTTDTAVSTDYRLNDMKKNPE